MSLHDEPEFQTVWAPESYSRTTESAVRFVSVITGDVVVGYLWAALTDDAARYVARADAGDVGANAGVAWVQRLRWAKANGLTPLRALRHWAGQAEDARAGRILRDAEQELPGLPALERLAAG
ncbi:hypothetical protein [Nonomuraea cavernae]|uniref:Uncharacterized protein n=1 Tax=Nonomuraea cavernae TaxID=2045107 RepID=A0A917Z9W8_9ACTN|nr:hypothetical protein [Nonomuraea cavernae]MCA2189374.1 hypothetical protein [Nonomuraea cavernae]GGO76972.1 hypothetical protein GCM10012289_55530 [Nonomuraea cavernae]